MIAGRRWHLLAALWLASLGLAGCNSEAARRPMRGRVEIDGEAVTRGSIGFRPAPGNSGPAASAPIVDGEYQFSDETGPHDGPHRVVIDVEPPAEDDATSGTAASAPRKAAGARTRQAPGARAAANRPVRRHWEVDYTVPAGGECRRDFELEG